MKKFGSKIKSMLSVLLVSCAALSYLSMPAVAADRQLKTIQWSSSVEDAQKEGNDSGKLVMMYFHATWCIYCKKMEARTYPDIRVRALATEFIPVQVDVGERGGATALKVKDKYAVKLYPTILFVDSTGKVVKRVGSADADKFTKILAQLLEQTTAAKMIEAGQNAPNDGALQARLAIYYATLGKIDEAQKSLRNAEVADPKNNSGMMAGAYQAIATYYYTNAQYKDAIEPLKHQISLAKDPIALIGAKLKLATSYIKTDQVSKATPLLNEVKNSSKATADEKELATKLLSPPTK